jgi:hypothetical protein
LQELKNRLLLVEMTVLQNDDGLGESTRAHAFQVAAQRGWGTQGKMAHTTFARHQVATGDVQVEDISTTHMLADMMTKQLPGPAFKIHRST